MSLFKYIQYIASCDECPAENPDYDNCTQQEAIKKLRQEGWSFGKKLLCPECNGKNYKK